MGANGLIIYYGHNEVPQFQQLSQLEGTAFLSARLFISKLRLYALLHSWLPTAAAPPAVNHSPTRKRLKELAIINHRYNLSQLLSTANQHDIPVLMIKPAYNFRFAPYSPSSNESLIQADQRLEEAKALRPQDIDKAIQAAVQCIAIAPKGSQTALAAHQLLAELYAQKQERTLAQKTFQALFDQAAETTTIHSEISKNITTLAQDYGAAYLDAQAIFYDGSADGITANTLFWDELHPSAEGHSRLHTAIAPWAQDLIQQWRIANSPDPAPSR